MRVYRYLLQRLAIGVTSLVGFSLLCFAIFSLVPPVGFPSLDIVPAMIWPLPEASPWDIEYTWLHFWMDRKRGSAFYEIGRFVFYITHMYRGEFGFSWETHRLVSVDLTEFGPRSILLILIALMIALWIILCSKLLKSNLQTMRNGKTNHNTLIISALSVMLVIVTGVFLVHFVSIICPFVFQHILFWSRYGNSTRETFNLYDPRYFAIPAFALAGALIIGWKLAMKIQVNPNPLPLTEDTNPPNVIRQAVTQKRLRVAFLLTFLLSSIVFIEATFPLNGIGRLFRTSLLAHNYSVTNTILFLSGFVIIMTSFSTEVIYGLLQFGPYRFHRFLFWKLQQRISR